MDQSLVVVLSIGLVKAIIVESLCVLLHDDYYSSVMVLLTTSVVLDRRATLHLNWSSKYIRRRS